jgi:hypothetical protein
MKIRTVLTGCAAIACLMTAGCYNNPHTSEKKPGEGPDNIHSRPAVGPGTTAGGSTAGPQPAKEETGGHVQPTPGGAVAAQPGLGHATAPQPQIQHGADTPKGPASQTGNEKGGEGRGPEKHAEGRH